MTAHARHPDPSDRDEFLVDDCPRCAQYVAEMGLPFTPDRFRAFWRKMVEVEFNDYGSYASRADRELGGRLYLVALAQQRAFGIHAVVLNELAISMDAT